MVLSTGKDDGIALAFFCLLLFSLSCLALTLALSLAVVNLQAALIGAEVALMLTFFGIKVGMARKKFNVPVRFFVL